MQRPTVAILGASGYAGVELSRLLALHPGVELVVAGSDRWANESVEARIGVAIPDLKYATPDRALEHAASCSAVLLATPAEISHEYVPRLAAKTTVIDLSGAFRLRDAAAYALHYGFVHQHSSLLADAVYGLPELGRARIAGARLIANPGCYATAIQLAIAPLASLVTGRWIVDAVSGVTGAGRKATEAMSFAEVAGDVRAYRALRHQHAPEIAQGIGGPVTFVPHLVPIARGILATCHARLSPGGSGSEIAAAYRAAYAAEPFIELAADADDVSIHHVVGTNRCRIGWTVVGDELVTIAAIDNLVKGAAGQAVQNLNLALGLPETTGLVLRSFHP
ncbi:MAG: N-acetyl-gamma-glutamyl-phosphate reductase [Kofleriaceae bacterium]